MACWVIRTNGVSIDRGFNTLNLKTAVVAQGKAGVDSAVLRLPYGGDMGDIFGDISATCSVAKRKQKKSKQLDRWRSKPPRCCSPLVWGSCFRMPKSSEINLKDTCTTCHGTGAKPGTSPETCSKCNGTDQITYTADHVRFCEKRDDPSGL